MLQPTGTHALIATFTGTTLPVAGGTEHYVINLCSSTTPDGLVRKDHPAFKPYLFFESRQRESGRERFRLHMGYFDSQQQAEELLGPVREFYPEAWVGVAPATRPRPHTLTRPVPALKAVVPPPPMPPIAPAAKPPIAPAAATSDSGTRSAIAYGPFDLVADSPGSSQPLELELEHDQPPPASLGADPAHSLLQGEPGGFAVQLLWSVAPLNLEAVTRNPIFSAYTLYHAEGNHEGRHWYSLRLGFFSDTASAEQVARYVRAEYASAAVVPVSVHERADAGAINTRHADPLMGAPLKPAAMARPAAIARRTAITTPVAATKPAASAAKLRTGPAAEASGTRFSYGPTGKRAKQRVPLSDADPRALDETWNVHRESLKSLKPASTRLARFLGKLAQRFGTRH